MNIVARIESDRRAAIGAQIQPKARQLRHTRAVEFVFLVVRLIDGAARVHEERKHRVGDEERRRSGPFVDAHSAVHRQRSVNAGGGIGIEKRDRGDGHTDAAVVGGDDDLWRVGVGAGDAIDVVLAAERDRAPPSRGVV